MCGTSHLGGDADHVGLATRNGTGIARGLQGNGDLHARCITTERTVLSAWPSCAQSNGDTSRTSAGATETVRSDEDNSVQCACRKPVVTKGNAS